MFNNLSPSLKWKLYKLYRIFYDSADSINFSNKRNNEIIYPKGKLFVGGGDFEKVGNEFFQYFKEFCNLQPNHKILDVGCGMGRMAIPLLNFLENNGSYEGFDVFYDGIKWARKKISKKHSNFNFSFVNIYNSEYNPKGTLQAFEYKFPYPDRQFNFIFATSLFTHLLPESIENYFAEINRVLKLGGKCLFTFLLLNNKSNRLILEKKSMIKFEHSENNYQVMRKKVPEHTIAYDESFVMEIYKKYNFKIIEPILYGSWCGRKKFVSFQDIIVASKP